MALCIARWNGNRRDIVYRWRRRRSYWRRAGLVLALAAAVVESFAATPLATTDQSKTLTLAPLTPGLEVSVAYPLDWAAAITAVDNVVRLVGDRGNGGEVCVLRGDDISDLGDAAVVQDEFIAIISNNEFSRLIPGEFEVISGQQIVVADRPGAQIVAARKKAFGEQIDYKVSVFSIVYVTGTLVVLSCDTRGESQTQALSEFKSQFPAFSAIANSLTIRELTMPQFSTQYTPIEFP